MRMIRYAASIKPAYAQYAGSDGIGTQHSESFRLIREDIDSMPVLASRAEAGEPPSFWHAVNRRSALRIGGDILPWAALWAQPLPWFCRSRPAIRQAAATECVPGEHERLKAMPPIGFDVAAPSLEQKRAACVVKPEFHGEGVALFRCSARGGAVHVLSQANTAAPVIGGYDPTHSMILS